MNKEAIEQYLKFVPELNGRPEVQFEIGSNRGIIIKGLPEFDPTIEHYSPREALLLGVEDFERKKEKIKEVDEYRSRDFTFNEFDIGLEELLCPEILPAIQATYNHSFIVGGKTITAPMLDPKNKSTTAERNT